MLRLKLQPEEKPKTYYITSETEPVERTERAEQAGSAAQPEFMGFPMGRKSGKKQQFYNKVHNDIIKSYLLEQLSARHPSTFRVSKTMVNPEEFKHTES